MAVARFIANQPRGAAFAIEGTVDSRRLSVEVLTALDQHDRAGSFAMVDPDNTLHVQLEDRAPVDQATVIAAVAAHKAGDDRALLAQLVAKNGNLTPAELQDAIKAAMRLLLVVP